MTPPGLPQELRFGAELRPGDMVRFRLWAPGQDNVTLVLEEKVPLPMPRGEDGWFELVTAAARPAAAIAISLTMASHAGPGLALPGRTMSMGPSLVVDPHRYAWRNPDWNGRPWHEAVLYELHVGTFSAEGPSPACARSSAHLAELGITAIELMPLADFAGGATGAMTACCPTRPIAPTAGRTT